MKLIPKGSNKLVKVGKSIEITNKLITEINSRKLERFELSEEQVEDLYEVLYGEVLDRIKDKKLPKFDINETIKETYKVVLEANPDDQVKALYYAQAIPDVFHMVMQKQKINDYIVNNNIELFGEIGKLRTLFTDLAEVGKAIGN